MTFLRRCLHELWTLFVDDAATAGAIAAWIAIASLTLRHAPVGQWSGPILFAGLAVIFGVGLRLGR